MGQYHYIVNITKRQFIHPHKIGSGLKLIEQIGWEASPSTALFFLLACSNGRGGGDVAEHPLVGSWSGDQIAVVGDYSTSSDIPGHDANQIYRAISGDGDRLLDMAHGKEWEDISPGVRDMMRHTLGAEYSVGGATSASGVSLDRAGWIDVTIPRNR
jgi:hypothetical protein